MFFKGVLVVIAFLIFYVLLALLVTITSGVIQVLLGGVLFIITLVITVSIYVLLLG